MTNLLLSEKRKSYYLLSLILVCAFVMRLWKIDFQSLWLDELHTMIECDPDSTWETMLFYLKCCDQQPPLYFSLVKISFLLFDHTAISARLVCAIAGTISVWGMYLLGKEILNRNLGLIAAVLTTINYYNLYYSQEARSYILAFLFATLSFLFLIRLLKKMNIRNSILYAVFSLLLLYSHYYSLFVVVSQIVVIVLLFFFTEKSVRKSYIKYFLLSGIIMGAGYLPWLPYLEAVSRIKAFWAALVPVTFVSDYFFEYFGNMKFLKPILLLLLSVYLFKVLYAEKKLNSNPAKSNPLWFSFIVLSVWIVVTYLIPYLRSLLVVPMLYPRYTIVVLPAFLIAIAYGIELIRFKALKIFVLSAFIIVSLTTLLFSRKYYSQVSKTQFREMTRFVVENNKQNYPIIDELVSWQHQYYFKALKFKPTILEGSKLNVIDSILEGKNQKYIVKGFWIVGAHGEKPLTTEQKTALDTSFVMTMEKNFFDSWAELYIRGKNQFTKTHKINTSKEPVVRHSLEQINDKARFISVTGWAFVDSTKNNKGDSIFFVLNNNTNTYIAPARIKSRPDVTIYFHKSYLDDAGFNALIFKDDVEKGTYELDIAIKNSEGKWIYQKTDKIINVGIYDYVPVKELEKLSPVIPIKYNLESLEVGDSIIKSSGWAYLPGQDNDNCKISLILTKGEKNYMVETELVLRKDVTSYFKSQHSLDHSGFSVKMRTSSLLPGKYEIGIMIRDLKTKKEEIAFSGRYIEIK